MPPILLALCLATSGFTDPPTQNPVGESAPRAEPAPGAEPARAAAWWSETQGGRLASFFGLGLALIAVGVVAFGKSRPPHPLARAIVWLLLAVGSLSFLMAVVAVAGGQPYAVYYPLFLFGGLAMIVSMGLRGVVVQNTSEKGPVHRTNSRET